MRFYRLHRTCEAGVSAGYDYFTNKRDAESALSYWRKNSPGADQDQQGEIDTIEIEPTRSGILAALNRYAAHADNG